MGDFVRHVELVRRCCDEGTPSTAVHHVLLALEALVAERAAERERQKAPPPLCEPPLTPEQVAAWHALPVGSLFVLKDGQKPVSGRAAALNALARNDALLIGEAPHDRPRGADVDLRPMMDAGYGTDGETAYQRAMLPFNRMSDTHPHDGSQIRSLRHWGMH